MWLIEVTINGTVNRISTEAQALTYYWHNYVVAFEPISYSMAEKTGGYIRPSYGSLELSPELFDDDYPPPVSCAVTVKYTDSDEASAVEIWSGYAHRSRIGRESISYRMYGGGYADTIVSTALSNTLVQEFTTYCGASHLNLTLDSTAARSPSPSISRASSSSDEPTIDVLSEIAAATNHCFYINDGTLYLIDMLADNGTSTLTEFDFLPVEYEDPPPYPLFRSGAYSVTGSYDYGTVQDLGTEDDVGTSDVEDQLADSRTILERPTIRITRPIKAENIPTFGEKISFADDSTPPGSNSISGWLRVRNLRFSGDGEFLVIEGEGAIA